MSINDGLALIRRHDFEGALPLLAAEVRKRPDDAYAAYYLAYAFVGAQDPQPAVTLLAKIVEVHPDFTDARTLLGLARIRISDFAGATTDYEAVIAREPKNAAALLGLWRIQFRALSRYLDGTRTPAEVHQAVTADVHRAAHLIGTPAPGYSSDQAMQALEQVANEVLPREMGFEWADISYQQRKAGGTGNRVFVLSLVCVFLILAALYESWSLPFSVLLSVPVAVLGAFLGLYLRNFDLGIFAQIGLAMLIGLAAKNAILIVEFARDEMKKGRPLVEAALEGARLRLRPILMTSFAFIFGMAPLWIATGAGAIARKILGTVVITGMLAATAIAIFIIPVLFVLVERLANRRGHEQPAPLPPEPEATP